MSPEEILLLHAQKIKYDFNMTYKTYQVIVENLKITDNEYDELIKYNESQENYEFCQKLKNKKDNK